MKFYLDDTQPELIIRMARPPKPGMLFDNKIKGWRVPTKQEAKEILDNAVYLNPDTRKALEEVITSIVI